MPEVFANDVAGTVSSGGTSASAQGTSETWTVDFTVAAPVASASATPPTWFYMYDTTAGKTSEKVLVTSCPGGTGPMSVTVTRGASNTATVAHTTGFPVQQIAAAATFANFMQSVPVPSATGTYATDQANVSAAASAAGAGGQLYVPFGTYSVGGLTPLSHQAWRGPGTLKWGSGTAETTVITASGLTGWTMDGLTVDGNQASNTSTYAPLISLVNSTGCVIENNVIQNGNNTAGVAAIQMEGTVRCTVRGNQFYSVGYGVSLGLLVGDGYSCYGNVITGNLIDTTQWDAIFVTENLSSDTEGSVSGNVQSTTISNNTIRNHGDGGIECGSGTVGTTVTGNSIQGSTSSNAGVYVRDSATCTVTGNSITGMSKSGSSGILVFDLNALSKYVTITGNSITNSFYGIQALGSETDNSAVNTVLTDLVISGNSIEGCSFGIYGSAVNRFSITGNTVSYCSLDGIELGGYEVTGSGCTNGTVTGNTVMSNGTSGSGGCGIVLLQACTDITIAGNRVGDDRTTPYQAYGIRIFDNLATSITVTDNDLTGSGVTAAFNCNFTPAASNKISVTRNPGWNPAGTKTVTAGTSPWTYTAGTAPEVLYLHGGTVSVIAKNSTTVLAATPAVIPLEPNEAVTVTYSAVPTAVSDVK